MNEMKPVPHDLDENQMARNAMIGSILLTVAGLLFVVVGLLIAEINSWKDYILVGAPAVLVALGLVSIALLRRGRITTGTSLIFIANLLLPVVETSLQIKIGWAIFVYITVSSTLLIWRSLPRISRRWAITVMVAALAAVAIIETIDSPIRINPAPELVTFIYIVTGILIFAFLIAAAQQVSVGNIRSRLILWFALVGLLPLTLIAGMSYYLSSQSLTRQTEAQLASIAEDKAQQIDLYASERQKDVVILARQQSTITALEKFTLAFILDGIDTEHYNAVDAEYRQYLTDFAQGYNYEDLFLISKGGNLVFSVKRGEDLGTNLYSGIYTNTELAKVYQQSQTLLEANFSDFAYYPPINEPAAFIAAPVMKDGELIGAVALQINNKALYATVNDYTGLGLTGEIQIGSKVGDKILYIIPLRNDPYAAFRTSTLIGSNTGLAIQQAIQGLNGSAVTTDYRGKEVIASWRYIPGLRWGMVAKIDTAEAYAPIVALRNASLVMGGLSLLVVIIVALLVANSIASPIISLTEVAKLVSGGDINAQAKAETADEVGTLATAFNSMTAQLRGFIGTLESRVAERTSALATVAEIGTATSTILDVDKLMYAVVELSKERFNLYHSHIYLMDETGENLVLASGAGEPGRIMVAEKRSIPLAREQSLVARAARERKGVTVNDVRAAPDFLPNPLLPDTRSELAVPMMVGSRVIGVFDIQSDTVGRFTDADVNIQNTLASQIAISVQNARQVQKSITLAAELAGFQSAVNEAAIIAVTDVTGKIETVNEQFMRISKYSREELLGQDHRILNSGYHSKEFIRDLWVTIANGRVWRNEIRNKAKDGSFYWVDTTIAPILDERGKPVKYVAIRFEITQRKEFELAAARRAAQVQALDNITQKIQSTTKIEAALQVTARELGHALGMKPTAVALNPDLQEAQDKETGQR